MTPERILLLTPLKGGLSPEYVVNLIAVLRSNSKGRYLWEWQVRTGTSVALARNELVVPVVTGKFDRCVFWDADVGDKDPNMMMAMFYRLLSHDVDCVAGAYVARTLKSYFHGGKVEGALPNENGLMAMQQMPLGFSAIKTRAFTKIMEKFPERRYLMKQPEESELPPNMFEFFPTGICGPCTGDGKVARIKDVLKDYKTCAANFSEYLEKINAIVHDTAFETNYMLGEDFYFPVSPDTKVLDAQWRWKALQDIQVGEAVMSVDETSTRHSSRRMRVSQIQHIVKRILPEYRIITEGREIRTTAEHPWLAIAENKNVDKTAWSWMPTAKLSAGSSIARVVPVVASPDITSEDYMRGYIQGLIQSDGTKTKKGQFSVRMCDTQPLERLATFLATLGIESTRRAMTWHDGNINHRRLHGVGIWRKSSYKKLESIVDITDIPSPLFASGYLAGMYDGDGSFSGTCVNIAQMKAWKKDRLDDAAKVLGFNLTRTARISYLTGTDNFYKFWMATSPSLTRKMLPVGQIGNDGIKRNLEVKHTPERVLSIEATGNRVEMWCPTTTSGTFIADGLASHNCKQAREAGVNLWLDNNLVVPHATELRLPLHSNEMLDALEEEWRHDIKATLPEVKAKIAELRAMMAKD